MEFHNNPHLSVLEIMSKHYYTTLSIDTEIFPEEYMHIESEDELRDVLFDQLIERCQMNPNSVDHFPFIIDDSFIDEWKKLKNELCSDVQEG